MQLFINSLFCVIIYYGIIRNTNKPKATSTIGFLVGFGFVIPLLVQVPFVLINFLDIRSKVIRMGLSATPMTMSLACLEAMFGFTKPEVSKSLTDYILAQAAIVRPDVKNGKHVKYDSKRHIAAMKSYFVWLFVISGLNIWLGPCNYSPFETSQPANVPLVSFELGQIYNTFFQAREYAWMKFVRVRSN